MMPSNFRFGFRIVGACSELRRLVDAGAAFAAYAARRYAGRSRQEKSTCRPSVFAEDFADHLKATGSTAGFSGPCWSPWLWLDLIATNCRMPMRTPARWPRSWSSVTPSNRANS